MPPRPVEALAIVVARDEQARVGAVLDGLPREVAGVSLVRLLVDDGSLDDTASVGRACGVRLISHGSPRGLGAALRSGLELARAEGFAAALYLDGDGEYDPAEAGRLLHPILAGDADYVLGSRLLGERNGMARHREWSNRALSALVGRLTGVPATDSQSGYRAFSARALSEARIRHDYNYAQVLTLALWGAGIDAREVPISYSRRAGGRSFIRHGEYLRRVAPALYAEWRAARLLRAEA